jgi:hypothetical protein
MDRDASVRVRSAAMSDVEIEKLLEPHAKDLESIADAAAKGERDK